MFGFKKIIFVLATSILLLGLIAAPLTSLARPEILKVAVVGWDSEKWETEVVPLFNNEYPEVKVESEVMSWEPLYARIMAIMDGRIIDCYDVVMMMSSTLPELSAYAEDLSKYRKDFESAGIDFVEYNGRILGVSLPGVDANKDYSGIISRDSRNRELALKLLMFAGGGTVPVCIWDYLNEAKILLQDSFRNSGSGWSISTNDERKKTYKRGKYSITVKKPNWQPQSQAKFQSKSRTFFHS